MILKLKNVSVLALRSVSLLIQKVVHALDFGTELKKIIQYFLYCFNDFCLSKKHRKNIKYQSSLGCSSKPKVDGD